MRSPHMHARNTHAFKAVVEHGETYTDVARRLGLSRERVRRIVWDFAVRMLQWAHGDLVEWHEENGWGGFYQISLDQLRVVYAVRKAERAWRETNASVIHAVSEACREEDELAYFRRRIARATAVGLMLDEISKEKPT